MIYGKHPVKEALKVRPDVVRMVHVAEDNDDTELMQLIEKAHVIKRVLNVKRMPLGVQKDAVHQGVIAEIDSSKMLHEYEEFMRSCTITNNTAFALLGEVQDPHNVGAIIRSAAAFGITAILIPEHRQVQVTGTVIKVSAGTAFRVPLVSIGNVNQTLKDLKEKGFWTYGLDGEAKQSVTAERFEKPSVLVVGNEADGIRKKTLEHCDIPLSIPMSSHAESLNASVAAAVVFYAWSTHHPNARSKK